MLVRSLSGKAKGISPLLWVMAVGFLVYFVRGPIETILGSQRSGSPGRKQELRSAAARFVLFSSPLAHFVLL